MKGSNPLFDNQPRKSSGIVVTYSTIVILLCPIGIKVNLGKFGQHAILKLTDFKTRQLLTAHCFFEDGLYLTVRVWFVIEFLYTVVAQFTTVLCKEIMTFL